MLIIVAAADLLKSKRQNTLADSFRKVNPHLPTNQKYIYTLFPYEELRIKVEA